MVQYFCRINNQEQGPFNREELDFLIQRGKLGPNDLIRTGQAGEWQAAAIFESFPSPVSSRQTQQNTLNSKVQRREPFASDENHMFDELSSEDSLSTTEEVPPDLGKKRFTLNRWLILGAVCLLLLLTAILIWYFYISQTETVNPSGANSSGNDTSHHSSNDDPALNSTDAATSQSPDSSTQQAEKPPEQPVDDAAASDEASDQNPPTVTPQENRKISSSTGNYTIPSGYFFDLPAYGARLIYVIDCSSSMAGTKIESAKQELMKSLRILNTSQQFYIIFFSDTAYPMFYPDQPADELLFATEDNIKRADDWLNNFEPSGGTDPTDALTQAFKLEPHTVYFLTDGAFNEMVVDKIQELNTKEIVINTIGFHSQAAEVLLKKIAANNAGKYKYVP